ncbi:MAG TPA: peptidoglycan-binding domain-containing protein [Candidatus Paceibacterota bacterium]
MEPTTTPKTSKAAIVIVLAVAIIAIAGGVFWYQKHSEAPFCFTFAHDTVFGDRTIANPSNTGYQALNGMTYYIPEVPALQTALAREGFYIDPLESTGGKIYYAAFYGPSTASALKEFQKKHKLGLTGIVENSTIDKLNELYGCPAGTVSPLLQPTETATSTATTTKQ